MINSPFRTRSALRFSRFHTEKQSVSSRTCLIIGFFLWLVLTVIPTTGQDTLPSLLSPDGASLEEILNSIFERSDFYVLMKDAGGLEEDQSVFWRGLEVGRVFHLSIEGSNVRIEVELDSDFKGKLRQGARALVSTGIDGNAEPALKILDGKDPDAPFLEKGARINTAKGYERLLEKGVILWVCGTLAIIGFAWAFRGVFKLMFKMLLVLGIVFMVYFTWQLFEHKAAERSIRASDPSSSGKWSPGDFKDIKSKDIREVWIEIQKEVVQVLQDAKQKGHGYYHQALLKTSDILGTRIEEVRRKGYLNVAADLDKLYDFIQIQLLAYSPDEFEDASEDNLIRE
ncbi:MAG TPA: MCE family protein [Verrucomicrobiales bacterium]|nr:MCE family protein [Verrucomicrobiales bacterium]